MSLRLRTAALLLGVLTIASACGAGTGASGGEAPDGSLEAIWKRPGDDVALVQGTSDYAAGRVRVSFLVVKDDGELVERPRAKVWLARGLKRAPVLETTATLEPIGVPGGEANDDGVRFIYVTELDVPDPGKWWIVAEPVGGHRIQGVATLVVGETTASLAVGEPAPRSDTPTLASTGGDLAALSTASDPERALYRHSVADALADGVPFVVVFATPKFCSSRTCGPTVDVVDAVRRRHEDDGVRFVHVEVYEGNDPQKGVNRWVEEWGLPTEPWVFVVGRDGRISQKFEGSVSVEELARAVERVA